MPPPEPGLASSLLFRGLSPAAIEEVLQAAHTSNLGKDEFLFHQGDTAEAVHVLSAGRLKLLQVTPEGQQVMMRIVGPWAIFSVIAVLPDQVYPVSAQAVEDCSVLRWSQAVLQQLIQRHPTIALNGMAILAAQVQDFQNRFRELATERVERRIARAVLRLAQQLGKKTDAGVLIDLALSRQDLAEMTGTTLYTVSRFLSQWEEQGLIEAGRERLVVKFPHGLVRIAEDLPGPPEK